MTDNGGGFFDWIATWLMGAWAAAAAGRLTYHTRMVRKGRRSLFSKELIYELPVYFFTLIVGVGIADHLGWKGPTANAVVAVVAYFGPGGLQALAQWWARVPREDIGK